MSFISELEEQISSGCVAAVALLLANQVTQQDLKDKVSLGWLFLLPLCCLLYPKFVKLAQIYVANVGDCSAFLVHSAGEKGLSLTPLSVTFE